MTMILSLSMSHKRLYASILIFVTILSTFYLWQHLGTSASISTSHFELEHQSPLTDTSSSLSSTTILSEIQSPSTYTSSSETSSTSQLDVESPLTHTSSSATSSTSQIDVQSSSTHTSSSETSSTSQIGVQSSSTHTSSSTTSSTSQIDVQSPSSSLALSTSQFEVQSPPTNTSSALPSSTSQYQQQSPLTNASSSLSPSLDPFFDLLAQYFVNYPLSSTKYGDRFGELGSRVRLLREWISISNSRGALHHTVEQVLISMFPFIRNPSKLNDTKPFSSLRKSFTPSSRGIVIPTGLGTFRFACHLVLAIRNVHNSSLPIQIVYAGDTDLPPKQRQIIADLVTDVEFLDILTVFDDETLQLEHGGWAIKAFAALASKYEKMILLDADTVFVQAPEMAFKQQGYIDTGIILYHDRLLWQHGFKDRHDWWKKQMEHHSPSPALLNSLVWMEDYAEEGDSGLIVLDKSRLPVLMGLLHICWQNTYAVREEITYKITYGDKESWWFGFELSGTPFEFEKHYGSIAGWKQIDEEDKSEKVCSFTIAHTDDKDKLLWYNGSLLKNKAADNDTFEVPTHWMMDATWLKGGSKPEISCMKGGEPKELTAEEMKIIERSIEEAKKFDVQAGLSLG